MAASSERTIFGLTGYQCLVLFAAWLGWGFDVFDALLFNYVSRLCIPSLLGPEHGDAQTVTMWTGALTSLLLVGWGIGGIVFGKITDRIGRSRALLYTMLTYALATAACAFSVNIWMLVICRFIASIGIGGEWAAGASLVAETIPEKRRVQAGAILYTAAPAGLFLATFVTDLFTRQLDVIAGDPNLSWRAVFLTGLVPAAIAILIRLKVKEPEMWKPHDHAHSVRELFTPELRKRTVGGLCMAAVALIAWWTCNAFLPTIASFLVAEVNPAPAVQDIARLKSQFVTTSTTWFNLGGLIGTILTVPIAIRYGRRPMFLIYFALSSAAIFYAFRMPLDVEARLFAPFFIGLTVFGIFGAFTFYLPELFPTHLRATGSGFCYNTGRFITAGGPFLVGAVAMSAKSSQEILSIVSWVGIVPLLGVLAVGLGLVVETKGQAISSMEK
ncbi:MAG: MFS transporter [Deltaproteobacteria bacterium]|nr:MFS transporter [Deltaproteobacteria bacterium]